MKSPDEMTPLEVYDLFRQTGNKAEVARILGKPRSWVRRRVEWALVELGSDPVVSDIEVSELISSLSPQDLALTGHSDFEGPDGELIRRWKKYNLDDLKRLERIKVCLEELIERLPRAAPVPAPLLTSDRLCNLYTFTDYHLGMYAHASMNGKADWNTDIARRFAVRALEQMIEMAPTAKKAVINIQGDWLHSDSLWPVTPTSRHPVDQDVRYEALAPIGMEVIERMVDVALMRHEEVELVIATGNHDLAGALWLRTAFNRIYRDEPRVAVNTRQDEFYAVEWGKTAIFIHHGHRKGFKKGESLALLYATRFNELWGRTRKRYGHSGHYHHERVEEVSGIKLMQHPTLAPNDSHGVLEGYDSERGAIWICYDLEAGEYAQGRISPEMVTI